MHAAYTAKLADKLIAGWPPDRASGGDDLILALAIAWNRGRAIAVGELGPDARAGLGLPKIDDILTATRSEISAAPDLFSAELVVRQAVLDCGLGGYAEMLRFNERVGQG